MLRILCHGKSAIEGKETDVGIFFTQKLITDELRSDLAERYAIPSKSQGEISVRAFGYAPNKWQTIFSI